MAIEMVPYSNFHDLNLDWILKTVKEVQSHVDGVDALVEDAEQYKNQAETAAQAAAQSVVDASGYASSAQTYANNAAGSYNDTLDLYNDLTGTISEDVTSWLEDNITQETGYVIDDTLTVQGAAADAKAAGDRIYQVESDAAGAQLAVSILQSDLAAMLGNFADPYNSSNSYTTGDYCTHNNLLFKCVADTTGAWDATAWANTTVGAELAALGAAITALQIDNLFI